MRRRIRIAALSLLLSLLVISQSGCGQAGAAEPAEDTTFLLNTICTVRLFEPADQELAAQALALCKDYEKLLSRTIADSDIGRINSAAGTEVMVDPRTAEVINKGLEYGNISGGLFDITVGELSDLWDFSGAHPKVPSPSAIAACLSHIDFHKVEVGGAEAAGDSESGKTVPVRLLDPQAKLDLGGVAKGYIADRIADFLREKGVKRAIIDLGGNIVAIGEKAEGTPWRIGIEMPFSDHKEVIGNVEIADQSIVTSGIYERQFEEDGVLYHHVLDPKTGFPRKTDLDAVSIIGSNSADCDALSTTCLALGLEDGKKLIESMPDFEAVFISSDGEVSMTSGVTLKK